MSDRTRLGVRIRALRTERGLSQEELAERLERSVDAVSKIERGVTLPSLETLIRLSAHLGVSVAELVEPLDQSRKADPEREQLLMTLLDLGRSLDTPTLGVAVDQVRILGEAGQSRKAR